MLIRQFARGDREQVTSLVNAHVAAVVPGASVSVQALMSHLEREPGEFIVDRWVRERLTLVAEQRGRVVAAAHLLRYADDAATGERYRNAGEIRWLACWPDAPYWPDAAQAGDALALACHAQFQRWGVTRRYADGAMPAPGVYGIPEQWPHIRSLYERAGFHSAGPIEVILLARVDRLPRPPAPVPGLTTRRTAGINGTRLTGVSGTAALGWIEVDTNLDAGPRMSRMGAWADIGNLWVDPAHRRQGIGTWLVGQAATWLELGGTERLLDYAGADEEPYRAFLTATGFTELTRTTRDFTTDPT
ncbi:GNAT family N-acetyltransferase [Actinoplanes sp. NPDC051861]|uniref:GNAT family N-acetyltransferase n=1 Tax=Actinoplanes sp. NPDC051861 TaxID=3155170 RepID=UPI0034215C41